jgi:predicted house-cleaning noncanonical NTP pyrophosphatase (MazG superfamily)
MARSVKLVRDKIGQLFTETEIFYAPPKDRRHHVELLHANLMEEATEYLLKPSVDELADCLAALQGLAANDLDVTWEVIEQQAASKAQERGGFEHGMAMYTKTKRPAGSHDDE